MIALCVTAIVTLMIMNLTLLVLVYAQRRRQRHINRITKPIRHRNAMLKQEHVRLMELLRDVEGQE